MGILVLAYAVKAVFQFVVTYWGHMLGVHIETDMRWDLFAHLQQLSFRFYDKHRTGSLMSRVISDLFEVVELAHHGPEDLFISLVTLTGALIIMFTIRWELALVIALLVPLLVGFTIFRRKHMGAASRAVKEKIAVINTGIESSITGIRTGQGLHQWRPMSASALRPAADSTVRHGAASISRWAFSAPAAISSPIC